MSGISEQGYEIFNCSKTIGKKEEKSPRTGEFGVVLLRQRIFILVPDCIPRGLIADDLVRVATIATKGGVRHVARRR